MKFRLASALALSLAFTQLVAAPVAFAQEPAQFRSAAPRSFSTEELQRYGLSGADAEQVAAYQDAGYQVQVISQEEADAMYAGQFSDRQWLVLGVIAVVVIVAVAVS